MYEEIHSKIRKEMDIILIGIVPDTVADGVQEVKATLEHKVTSLTGNSEVKIEVWSSYEDPRLLRFEYIYMDGPKPVFGWYLLNTRFWDKRHLGVPEPYVGKDVCPTCEGTKVILTTKGEFRATMTCSSCLGSGKKTLSCDTEDTQ